MHKILQIQTMFLAFPRDFPKPILRKLNLHFSLYLVMKIFSQTKKGGRTLTETYIEKCLLFWHKHWK